MTSWKRGRALEIAESWQGERYERRDESAGIENGAHLRALRRVSVGDLHGRYTTTIPAEDDDD